MAASPTRSLVLDIAYLTRPKEFETENGDSVVVRSDTDATLFGVIDGLGHGAQAARASQIASSVLGSVAINQGVKSIMQHLHAELRGSRGVAALVCVIRGSELEGCSVGNVELSSIGTKLPIMLTPGILGGNLRSLRVFTGTLNPSTRLVSHSDGISSRFPRSDIAELSPRTACEHLIRNFSKPHDDATVLVLDAVVRSDTRA